MQANMVKERYEPRTHLPSERAGVLGAPKHLGYRETLNQRALRLGQCSVRLRLSGSNAYEAPPLPRG
jgi:hypothetical protein